ncbi:MAG TPA: cytochrome c [Vicinamibacterales bacterium]|nr:cytochrome c [Vicinamibacterales bacterium]
MTTFRLFIAFTTAAAVTATAWVGTVDARAFQGKAASEGIYTKAQAERGLTVYDTGCASCHELGKFKGAEFSNAWVGKPLTDLHAALTSMPMDAPGSLAPQEYADIIAYFLSINDYPAGEVELAGDEETIKSVTLDPVKP